MRNDTKTEIRIKKFELQKAIEKGLGCKLLELILMKNIVMSLPNLVK